MIKRFNIRIYGLWIREKQLLISNEKTGDFSFNKFPGGGLEQGEGIADALKREFREELGLEISTLSLFFVNENYVPSAFDPSEQLISIYFLVQCSNEPKRMRFEEVRWNKPYVTEFSWIDFSKVSESLFHFPVDKEVAAKLIRSTF